MNTSTCCESRRLSVALAGIVLFCFMIAGCSTQQSRETHKALLEAFYEACKRGDSIDARSALDKVAIFADAHIEVSYPLLNVAREGRVECVEILTELGADPLTPVITSPGVAVNGAAVSIEATIALVETVEAGPDGIADTNPALREAAALGVDSDTYRAIHKILKDAEEKMEKLIADPSEALSPRDEVAIINRGISLLRWGKPGEADSLFGQVLLRNPENKLAWWQRGHALGLLGDLPQAMNAFDKALGLELYEVHVLSDKAMFLNGMGDFKRALDVAEQAISANGRHADAWSQKARAHHGLRQIEQAMGALDRVSALRPDDHTVEVIRAHILATKDKPAEHTATTSSESTPDPAGASKVLVRHILVSAPRNLTEAERVLARQKAEELRSQLLAGVEFATLAAEHSDCPSKERGGRLGPFTRGTMVRAFEEASFSQEVGAIGVIVETEYGYHIIQVLERL